jgi:hypothetical protein
MLDLTLANASMTFPRNRAVVKSYVSAPQLDGGLREVRFEQATVG